MGEVVYVKSYGAQDMCNRTEYYSKLKEFLVENEFGTKATIVSIIDTDGKIIRANQMLLTALPCCGLAARLEQIKGSSQRLTEFGGCG
jgi:hypothetical protein